MGRPIDWDFEWIHQNFDKYELTKDVCREYNKAHNTNFTYPTFRCCCNRMGLFKWQIMYTDEQIRWLIDNYSKLGRNKATKQLNEKFGCNFSVGSVAEKCKKLGLRVNKDIVSSNHSEYNKKFHVGDIVFRSGRKFVQITEETVNNGGKVQTLGKYVWEKANGKIPDGYILIYLDGDYNNAELSNMRVIPHKYMMHLSRYNKWYGKNELTEVGIKYCDMISALKELKERIE